MNLTTISFKYVIIVNDFLITNRPLLRLVKKVTTLHNIDITVVRFHFPIIQFDKIKSLFQIKLKHKKVY